MLLSVIVPCFNEEGNIDLFYDETVKALGDLMPETELIFVNDGSRDGTVEKLRALCARAQYRVRVVSFSMRNSREESRIAVKTFAATMIAALTPVVCARPM